MRYYSFVLKTTSEKIKEGGRANITEYDWATPIFTMNNYIYRNLKNGIFFFAYNEEENATYAAFAYEEKKYTFSEAYDQIKEILSNSFSVKQIKSEPTEITPTIFYECVIEANRRVNLSIWRAIDSSHLEYYDAYYKNQLAFSKYQLEEKIVSEKCKKINPLYDAGVINELSNIESHENTSDISSNTVHYIISTKSTEAANDITEALVQRLVKANRLSSRRIEIISEIDPELFKGHNYLEDIIKYNCGGVIVFNLSVKFSRDATDYGMASKFIEKLVMQYRSDCLFVFIYNTDNPGFAYQLLKSVNKYIITIPLKEGTGDSKAAVKYLKELIKDSEYSQYAGQANEFMKMYPGKEFTQTDILTAYEKFKPWCINKNEMGSAYDYGSADAFMLDRDKNNDSSYEKLKKLIGLTSVKEQVDNIIAANVIAKERKKRLGNDYEIGTMHMIFSGNPGTAKTTVAKLFAGIAKEKGILKSGICVERGGMQLNSPGHVREAFMAAEGGVLFIDEAYSLIEPLAITALIQEMENRRESVIVVLAGYNNGMKGFLEANEGLKSRIPYWIDFPDYNVDELTDIFKSIVKGHGFEIEEDAVKKARNIFDRARYMDNFGNGRFVRNQFEQAVQNQAVRLHASCEDASKIQNDKLFLITAEDIYMAGEKNEIEREYGAAQKELDDMIGLTSVKEVLSKVIAGFKLKKLWNEKGVTKEKPSLHMVFTGNPGTAKTTVARLVAQIMKDEKILPSGNFVEVGRADLISPISGYTAHVVKHRFKEAQGGILFIDEAYALCDAHLNSQGDEAISTIVMEMENHKDDVIVIFAGYSNEMKAFLDRNEGMASRIAFHVEFEDYTVDELCDITRLMLSKKQMTITSAAMEKLKKIYEKAKNDKSFGNGRFVRKMIDEAEMNLAERVSKSDESKLTTELLTTIEEEDIPEYSESKNQAEKKHIGF